VKVVARLVAPLTVSLAVVIGLSGCNTSPGAAALVGDDRISADTLQQEVNRALADPQADAQLGADRAAFTRTELGRLIHNRIIAAAAAAHHVTVSAADIDAQIASFAQQAGGVTQLQQQAAQGGVPKKELRDFIRFYVMEQKLADALVADVPVSQSDLQAAYQQNIDQYDQVHSAHILVKTKAQADSILAQVRADPTKFAALAARFSSDTSNKASGGDLGFAGKGQFVPEFSDAIFAAKPGSFIEVHSQFGWHVVHVIAHRRVSLAKAAPQLKTTLLKDARDRLLATAEKAQAKRLGIHVNPRYGRWDPSKGPSGDVVAIGAKQEVSTPSPSPNG
jgi:parvulin-like peptidyl-prolyl isomerase